MLTWYFFAMWMKVWYNHEPMTQLPYHLMWVESCLSNSSFIDVYIPLCINSNIVVEQTSKSFVWYMIKYGNFIIWFCSSLFYWLWISIFYENDYACWGIILFRLCDLLWIGVPIKSSSLVGPKRAQNWAKHEHMVFPVSGKISLIVWKNITCFSQVY